MNDNTNRELAVLQWTTLIDSWSSLKILSRGPHVHQPFDSTLGLPTSFGTSLIVSPHWWTRNTNGTRGKKKQKKNRGSRTLRFIWHDVSILTFRPPGTSTYLDNPTTKRYCSMSPYYYYTRYSGVFMYQNLFAMFTVSESSSNWFGWLMKIIRLYQRVPNLIWRLGNWTLSWVTGQIYSFLFSPAIIRIQKRLFLHVQLFIPYFEVWRLQ